MKRFILFFLLAVSLVSHAQEVPQTTTEAMSAWVDANRTNIAVSAKTAAVGAAAIAVIKTGEVIVSQSGRIASAGASIPVVARAAIAKPQVVAAVARFFGRSLPVVGIGMAGMQLLDELGFTGKIEDDGSVIITKPDPSICTSAPCYMYKANQYQNISPKSSPQAMCTAIVVHEGGTGGRYIPDWGDNGNCLFFLPGAQWETSRSITRFQVGPSPGKPVPATIDDVIEKLNSKNDFNPATSALPRIVQDEMRRNPALFIPSMREVSGPSSVALPRTVVNDGKVTHTTESTVNCTYGTSTMQCKTVSETRSTDNTTGATVGTSTQTRDEPAKPEEAPPVDTPMGDVPVLYKAKYKDGLKGVWAEKSKEFSNSSLIKLVGSLMPSVASNGAYPKFSLNFDLGRWQFGVGDFSPPNFVWDVARVIMICSALILARRLVFGG